MLNNYLSDVEVHTYLTYLNHGHILHRKKPIGNVRSVNRNLNLNRMRSAFENTAGHRRARHRARSTDDKIEDAKPMLGQSPDRRQQEQTEAVLVDTSNWPFCASARSPPRTHDSCRGIGYIIVYCVFQRLGSWEL